MSAPRPPRPRHQRRVRRGRVNATPRGLAAATHRSTRIDQVAEMSNVLERTAREVRVDRAQTTADLTLRLLHTDRSVRELAVDYERGSVVMCVGSIRVRAAVGAPEQFREAAGAAEIGELRLAAAAPLGSDRLMLGFRASGDAVLTVVETLVELPA